MEQWSNCRDVDRVSRQFAAKYTDRISRIGLDLAAWKAVGSASTPLRVYYGQRCYDIGDTCIETSFNTGA